MKLVGKVETPIAPRDSVRIMLMNCTALTFSNSWWESGINRCWSFLPYSLLFPLSLSTSPLSYQLFSQYQTLAGFANQVTILLYTIAGQFILYDHQASRPKTMTTLCVKEEERRKIIHKKHGNAKYYESKGEILKGVEFICCRGHNKIFHTYWMLNWKRFWDVFRGCMNSS